MKTCSKCSQVKELEQFHNRAGSSDGKRAACRECINKQHIQRRKSETKEDLDARKRAKEKRTALALEGRQACTKCRQVKSFSSFHQKKSSRHGVGTCCKKCSKEISRSYYESNMEHVRERSRDWHHRNRDHANQLRSEKYYADREGHLAKSKKWREENRELDRENSRKWYRRNKDKAAEKQRAWYERNKEKCILNQKRWVDENKDHHLAWKREYYRNYYAKHKKSPEFKLSVVMRVTLRRQLRMIGTGKDCRTQEALGYTPEDLKSHLERQFTKGMTWDNYGDWHIDHITSVSEHIRNGETDPKIINCLTNLRPMWAKDNQSKNSKRTHLI